jgi:hypothetical protein
MEGSEGMDGRNTQKVICMRGWREARKLQETLGEGIFYQSLVAGEAVNQDKDSRHFEILYTVSAEGLSEDDPLFDVEEGEVLSTVMDEERGDLIPLNRQVIEKYEFYDVNTDDIHVIYRIPYSPIDHNSF